MRTLGRICLVIVLTVVLAGLWNISTLISISKPRILAVTGKGAVSSTQEKREKNTFYFDRLGITAPITETPKTSPLRVQDWNSMRAALTHGVNLSYTEDSFDQAHMAFLTGHSSDSYPHPYSSIFAGLGEAKVGDQVTMALATKTYQFKVVDIKVLDPANSIGFTSLQSNNPEVQRLILVTCWPLFTTSKRLVVVTEAI